MLSNESILWLNCQLISAKDAKVSPFDRGFTVGDGAFETLRAYNGKIFGLKEHWERLKTSCEILEIQPPAQEIFSAALTEVLAANQLLNARLRFTVTSGTGDFNSSETSERTILATAMTFPLYGPTEKVVILPWFRNENSPLVSVKSTSYSENVLALKYAKRHGAGEGIWSNTRGELCEGSTSNIFIVKDGQCFTPPLSSGCLPGITRAFVLQLARENGISIQEKALPLSALLEADEAFLTSSLREVHPISHVNEHTTPEAPGPLGQHMSELLKKAVSQSHAP